MEPDPFWRCIKIRQEVMGTIETWETPVRYWENVSPQVIQTPEQGAERFWDLHPWSKIPPGQGCEQPDLTTKPVLSGGLDSISPEVPLDPSFSHVMRSVCDDRLGCAWIFPASSADAFSRQTWGDAEFPNPRRYRHGPDQSFPETVLRPKGTVHS